MNLFALIPLNLDTVSAVLDSALTDTMKSDYMQQPVVSAFTFLKVFFILILIVGFILLALWIMKKLTPRMGRIAHGGTIKILSSNYLGPKKSLYLVEVGEKVLLIGVTDANISLITEFKDPEELEKLQNRMASGKAEQNFASLLASFFPKSRNHN